MAADSAITYTHPRSRKITRINETGWTKVLKAPKIYAAVGYWGDVGRIHSEFDRWLQKEIDQASYSDLPSLATALAEILNEACNNKPLDDDQCAGLHVAGFHDWHDKKRRPVFFHIYNGLELYRSVQFEDTDASTGTRRPFKVELQFETGPRTLFEPHQDFPNIELSLEQNLAKLEHGHLTRNGAFYYYSVMWDKLKEAFEYLNRIPEFKIPRSNSLGSRRALLIAALEITIRLYKLSNQPRIIGGKPMCIAINENGYMT